MYMIYSVYSLKCFALFSPSMLSNPKFSCHLGNFLCFQRNPIRILLTGKSNKNSIYTRASKIWSNEVKTCLFQKSQLWEAPVSQKSSVIFREMNISTIWAMRRKLQQLFTNLTSIFQVGVPWSQACIFARRSCLLFFSLRGGTTSLLDFCKRKPMLWDG